MSTSDAMGQNEDGRIMNKCPFPKGPYQIIIETNKEGSSALNYMRGEKEGKKVYER